VPEGVTPTAYLRQETYIGAHRRFPAGIPHKVQQQIEHELGLIADLKYEPYFLTVYDIVRFARNQGILCQGRGSAANSAVCYCLGVTEVDPARSNMLFERFVSKERADVPDIDVDYEHNRREEVIQYIYAKYTRTRAALAAAVTTYRPKSALRDSGKALGIDPVIVDKVAKAHYWFDSSADLLKRFTESGLDPAAPIIQQWANLAAQLLGFPRHLSIFRNTPVALSLLAESFRVWYRSITHSRSASCRPSAARLISCPSNGASHLKCRTFRSCRSHPSAGRACNVHSQLSLIEVLS
jgi:error-prone DNA polymerase